MLREVRMASYLDGHKTVKLHIRRRRMKRTGRLSIFVQPNDEKRHRHMGKEGQGEICRAAWREDGKAVKESHLQSTRDRDAVGLRLFQDSFRHPQWFLFAPPPSAIPCHELARQPSAHTVVLQLFVPLPLLVPSVS